MRGQTQIERNQQIVNKYREAGQEWSAPKNQIAAWAIREGLWRPSPDSLVSQCADQLAEAMRVEYHTDAQGRTVRSKFAAPKKIHGDQLTYLWDDIRTAPPEHMKAAIQVRRNQIVGDCRQLKNDVDSYNENHNPGKPIQLILDFTQDVAELEATEALDRRRRPSGPRPPSGRYPAAPQA